MADANLKMLAEQKEIAASDSSRHDDDVTITSKKGQDEEAFTTEVKHELNHHDDPNAVDWDGENDPKKALNWTPKKKWLNIFTIAVMTLLT